MRATSRQFTLKFFRNKKNCNTMKSGSLILSSISEVKPLLLLVLTCSIPLKRWLLQWTLVIQWFMGIPKYFGNISFVHMYYSLKCNIVSHISLWHVSAIHDFHRAGDTGANCYNVLPNILSYEYVCIGIIPMHNVSVVIGLYYLYDHN